MKTYTPDTHLQILKERSLYLEKRAAAKAELDWENQYDLAECAALKWAIEQLEKLDA